MRSFTLRAVAFFTATRATPLPGDSGDLPALFVPAPGSLLAETFQIPAAQSLDPTNTPGSGISFIPATDAENGMEANVDFNDDDATLAVHVASGAVSPSDADVNLFDPSNPDQFKLETALSLPSISLTSDVLDESKTNLADSANDPQAASGSGTACIDSSTGGATKIRRGFWDFLNLCPVPRESNEPSVPPLLPKPAPKAPIPAPPPVSTPEPNQGSPNEPAREYWYSPRINGGSGLGGEASCEGSFKDFYKVHTVVCLGPATGWNGNVASMVKNCQRCMSLSQIAGIRGARSFWFFPQPFAKRKIQTPPPKTEESNGHIKVRSLL
ncbi:hypothetical protein MMC29_006234 [Sticta canariensis]|nr:hypothetical protein [Sticta canariensis]